VRLVVSAVATSTVLIAKLISPSPGAPHRAIAQFIAARCRFVTDDLNMSLSSPGIALKEVPPLVFCVYLTNQMLGAVLSAFAFNEPRC
jgi:hypothetical protein